MNINRAQGRPKYSVLTDTNAVNKATYLFILLGQVLHVHNIVRISNILREIFRLQNTGTVYRHIRVKFHVTSNEYWSRVLTLIFLVMCRWPLKSTTTIWRSFLWPDKPHLSHFWENVIFAIPTLARFRRWPFHEPNLMPWIKYMKSSASESIRSVCFNSEGLSRSFRLARPGILHLERLWNGFDSDAELFMYQT